MNLTKKVFAFFITLLLISSHALHAQRSVIISESYDKKNLTNAKLRALVGTAPSSGYMPFRLTLKNGSKAQKTWELNFKSKAENDYSFGRRDYLPTLTSDFSYDCPPMSTKTYDILVPATTSIPDSHIDTAQTELSVTMKMGGESSHTSLDGSQHLDVPATLLSSDLYTLHRSKFDSYLPSTSSRYLSGNESYTTEFFPSHMSDDWRAYSGFDALVCTDNNWRTMSAEVKNAILEWNRLGGNIFIYKLNSASNFKSLDIDKSEDNKNKKTITRSFGKVTITPLANIKSLDVKKATNLIEGPKTRHSKLSSINNDYEGSSGWSLQDTLGKLSFSPIYLILILIAFGILVGPVNLFVFAKAGKRHRLFITTPIIALGASLVLIILIIIQDGFGGHGQRVQLIEVRADGSENKAYIWQEQAARTGVILGSSFETSAPTYISPVPLSPSRFSRVTRDNYGGASNYTAQHGTTGLAASGDWFQSRSVHGHYLESIIPTRGRITLKSNQGAPTLNSSFDYNIKSLIYIDDTDQTWIASDISAGDSVTLNPSNPADSVKLIHTNYVNMSDKLQRQINSLRKRKNHFIAITDDAPGIDTLDSVKWTQTTSIITGPVVK